MHVRRATTDDALDILAWRNDPETIAMSKTVGPIDAASHQVWFDRSLANPDRLIFVAVDGDQKIGMVRFDRAGDTWAVSINVSPKVRNRGYGRAMLTEALAAVRPSIGRSRIVAEVREDNVASLRLFDRCGFAQAERKDGFIQVSLAK